ncbi:MAG: EamA family transporter [Alphaproteobacteria bacterium]
MKQIENTFSTAALNPTGVGLIFFSAISFALKGVVAKLIFAEGVTVATLLFIRFLLATPLFWSYPIAKGAYKKLRQLSRRDLLLCMATGLLFACSAITDFIALSYIAAGVERMILFTYPAFIIIFRAIGTMRLPPKQHLLAFLVAEAGIIFLMGALDNDISISTTGVCFALAAAACYACQIMISQKAMETVPSILFTCLTNTVTFIAIALYFVSTTSVAVLLNVSMDAWFMLLFISIFCTVIPFFTLYEGIKRIGSEASAIISMIGPVITILAAYILLNEVLSFNQLTGAVLVFLGIATLRFYRVKDQSPLRP